MLGSDSISHSSEGEKELDIDFSSSIIDWISIPWWLDILCGWRICIDFDSWFPFQFQTAALYERRRSIPLWREIFKNHEVTFRSAFREINQWPPKRGSKTLKWSLSSWLLIILKVVGQFFPSLMSSQSDGREKLRMLSCKPLMFSILAL